MYSVKFQSFLMAWLMYIFLSPSLIVAERAKICLTMIVRNEEKVLERCLNSVKDTVDFISICDTGSTDATIEIIERFLETSGIPGEVQRHTWKNFGHNRTLSVLAAQKTLEEHGFPLEETFLLLIDADMLLKFESPFWNDSLLDDSYLFLQKSSAHAYYNTRLVRASLPWKCVGVTHEYWSCMVPCSMSKLSTISIDDRDDGGCKADKFERDIRLLTEGLTDEPDNRRYLFYLAQSHRCLQNHQEAIKWYTECIEKGGWFEEIWYSKFMIGQCYEEMKEWDTALSWYLDAYQFNPERAEPLRQISNYYRNDGQHHVAYFFAKEGASIPYPHDQLLFVAYPVYDYLFDEDISISAFFTPYKEEGFAAANRLLMKKSVPYYVKDQASRNILFYVPHLPNTSFEPIMIDLPLIREGFAAHYNPMNPSIKKTDEGFDVICRTVNYMQIGAKHFKSLDWLDSSNTVRTRNFLVRYDKDLKMLSQQEIVENLPRLRKPIFNVEGLEDCRLFRYEDSLWFSCTTLDTSPCKQPQVSLCKLEKNGDCPTIAVERLIPLLGPDPFRCEKNWLPFVKNDILHVIYSFDPFIVFRPDLENVCAQMTQQKAFIHAEQKFDFSRFSGSAPPIEFDGGYLVLVHEAVYNDQRIYTHRFVYLDQQLTIQKVSNPFTFLHQGIEYCCGMALDHDEFNLIMTIGLEDREAYFCKVDLDTVRNLLVPLDDY